MCKDNMRWSMLGGREWLQPRENTIQALSHGIQVSDGIEFDLRLTKDNRLILHHDSKTEYGDYPECMNLDELPEYIEPLDDLLANSNFIRRITEEGAFACIELKPPHPSSGKAGGWIGGKKRKEHMINMIESLERHLDPLKLNKTSNVVYSFEPKLIPASKQISSNLEFSRLRPYIRQWGNWNTQRIAAAPSFLMSSLPRLLNKQRKEGSPMLPCTLQYLKGIESRINLGLSVGLKGSKLDRLNKHRRGYPVYVWPCGNDVERLLLDAGLTGITDDLSPNSITLKGGDIRWTTPATKPITDEQRADLDNIPKDQHANVLSKYKSEVTPWHEMSNEERKSFIKIWRSKWSWERNLDTLLEETTESSLPWEVSRLIGHRGAGKTHSA